MTEDHKTWFVALLFLIINVSHANQTQDTPKPAAIEQQENETSAKEDKSVDNSKKKDKRALSDGIDDLKPWGIVINTSTEAQIKSKYKVINEVPSNSKGSTQFDSFKTLICTPVTINSDKSQQKTGLVKILVKIDEMGTVKAVSLLGYKKDEFEKLSQRLSKKYKLTSKTENNIEYKSGDILIRLRQQGEIVKLEYLSDDCLSTIDIPSPYGIVLGVTTEDMIRSKYVVKKEVVIDEHGHTTADDFGFYHSNFPNMRMLILDKKPFCNDNLSVKEVRVLLGKDKKVHIVTTEFENNLFDYLKEILKEKYKFVEEKEEPFYKFIIFEASDKSKILLEGTIFGDRVYYVSLDWGINRWKDNEKKKKAIQNLL